MGSIGWPLVFGTHNLSMTLHSEVGISLSSLSWVELINTQGSDNFGHHLPSLTKNSSSKNQHNKSIHLAELPWTLKMAVWKMTCPFELGDF